MICLTIYTFMFLCRVLVKDSFIVYATLCASAVYDFRFPGSRLMVLSFCVLEYRNFKKQGVSTPSYTRPHIHRYMCLVRLVCDADWGFPARM